MSSPCVIGGLAVRPALFCAPLAGITHSAFRRLVAEFGGCGAFFTEMLAAKQILHEDLRRSPWHKRSPGETILFCQLMIRETDPLDRIIARLEEAQPNGIDINLACHAPTIRSLDSGSRLFENLPALTAILQTARRCWPGPLTVKIRLGSSAPDWEARFAERMRLFEDSGVDAVILHPRFFEDRFKRRVRSELYAWAASLTRLPLIANGDIAGPDTIRNEPDAFKPACGLMVGRMAVVQPWIFAAWERPLAIDLADVWQRLCGYIVEDFPPKQALARIKIFTEYYARNFHFGHGLFVAVQNAPDIAAARGAANDFFSRAPAVHAQPSLMGL